MVDQVQNVLLGPILDNIKSANPNAPDIAPAIGQILNGFRGLNAAISTVTSADEGSTTIASSTDMLD